MTPLIQDGTYPVRRIATLGPRVLVVQVYLQPPFPVILYLTVPYLPPGSTCPYPGILLLYRGRDTGREGNIVGVVPVGMEVMVPGYSLYYTLGIPVYNPGYRIHTYPGAVGHLSIGSSILPGIPGVP